MRLFVGIPLAATVTQELSGLVRRLQSGADGLRWSRSESWHVTLQFLGNASPEQCRCTIAQLRQLHLRPVPIALEGLGFFDRAGVFFAGVNVTPELQSLHEQIIQATSHCGFVADERPFQPHITLARCKKDRQAKPFAQLKAKVPLQTRFTMFTARECLLYESFLGPGGSRYEVRERFPLDLHSPTHPR